MNIDEQYKSELIGFVYKKMNFEDLNIDDGVRIILSISKVSYIDLKILESNKEMEVLKDQDFIDSVQGTGIISAIKLPGLSFPEEIEKIQYQISRIGMKLKNIITEYNKIKRGDI